MPATKPTSRRLLSHALVLDSGANINILNNPNFYLASRFTLVNISTPPALVLFVTRWGGSAEP